MIDLLPGIQTVLREAITYIRQGDIFLTGFTELPPDDVMLPAIGIKDGDVIKQDLAAGMVRYTMQVWVIIWTQVLKEQLTLIGGGGAKGILEIENDVNIALDENLLGDETIQSADPVSPAPESKPVTDGNRNMQRKDLKFVYVKETARPSAARTGG